MGWAARLHPAQTAKLRLGGVFRCSACLVHLRSITTSMTQKPSVARTPAPVRWALTSDSSGQPLVRRRSAVLGKRPCYVPEIQRDRRPDRSRLTEPPRRPWAAGACYQYRKHFRSLGFRFLPADRSATSNGAVSTRTSTHAAFAGRCGGKAGAARRRSCPSA